MSLGNKSYIERLSLILGLTKQKEPEIIPKFEPKNVIEPDPSQLTTNLARQSFMSSCITKPDSDPTIRNS